MQKSQEKAGYNRLHVAIKKPERRLGETENAYIERANGYFEDTVTLFSGIKPSDSAVTWDDIEIKTVGPASGYRQRHQFMVHVAPGPGRGYLRRGASRSVHARLFLLVDPDLGSFQVRAGASGDNLGPKAGSPVSSNG